MKDTKSIVTKITKEGMKELAEIYKNSLRLSIDGGCPPCCACCGFLWRLAEELGIKKEEVE